METRGEIRRLLLARKMYRPKIIFSLLTSSKEKEDCHFTKNKVVTFIYNDKFTMYSDSCDIILSSLTASRRQYQNKPRPSDLSPLIPPKNYWIHSRGAKIQKIKRIDHCKCNVRASKNAEQAFSTQWYLYSGYGLIVLFSSVSSNESNSKIFHCYIFCNIV